MNLFVHPSKGFSNPSVDTELSTERITVVPTAHTLPPALLTRFTASAVRSGMTTCSESILCLVRSSTSTVLKLPNPTCSVRKVMSTPLISSLFIRCLLKCSPAVGAAAGVCCIARKRGKKAQIVIDMDDNAAGPILKRLAALPEYKDAFISGSDAFIKAQPGALLVVVDTNRPDFVESEQLLDTCNRVAVIDHHRRAASYIESAALNFHEPYASSASELVSELLQYLIDPGDLLRAEAEALFAGIVLDTKNFTMRTGGRTFEAAALLRRVGVDTADVQRLFQGTLSDMIERYDIIRHAELYHNDIAIAAVEQDIDRVTAAKAADELLTLRGVRASFVLFKHDTGVNLSARSLGEINVQLIMEKLGGGGNSTTAGGQIPDGTVDAVREQLIAAIDQYLEG